MLLFGLLQQRIIREVDADGLQIAFPGGGLGGDDLGRGHVQHEAVNIGQLVAGLIDAVEKGVALKDELLGRGRGARAPRLQRRQVGVFRAVLARHLVMQALPVIDADFLDQLGQLFRRLILGVKLPHIGLRHAQQQRQGGGEFGQEIGDRAAKV